MNSILWFVFRYFLIGGPGGKRLSPESVGAILVKIPGLVSLGSYPSTGAALAKVYSAMYIFLMNEGNVNILRIKSHFRQSEGETARVEEAPSFS